MAVVEYTELEVSLALSSRPELAAGTPLVAFCLLGTSRKEAGSLAVRGLHGRCLRTLRFCRVLLPRSADLPRCTPRCHVEYGF